MGSGAEVGTDFVEEVSSDNSSEDTEEEWNDSKRDYLGNSV